MLCDAGSYLDQSRGCQTCPKDTYSVAGNTAAECTACPAGKEVAPGLGTQEDDCSWSKLLFDCSDLHCDENYIIQKYHENEILFKFSIQSDTIS